RARNWSRIIRDIESSKSMSSSQSPRGKQSLREKAAKHDVNRQQRILKQIDRARTRLLVCLLTLPVYVGALWVLLNNGRDIDSFMYIYMAVWAGFAVDMARRRCPLCNKQFYVKTILLNMVTRRCVHCGAQLGKTDSNGDGGLVL
ncbi:MAG: hypothetical protein RLO18_21695, partial [Gimesia chilikensis]